MKRNILRRFFYAIVFASLSSGIASCDKEKEDDGINMGADNTTDIAVTGGVESTGMTYANVLGYVNVTGDLRAFLGDLDVLPFGVCYSKSESFSNSQYVYCYKIMGNKFSLILRGLEPDTKYFYRTFVGNQYGVETGSFTTKPFSNVVDFRIGSVSKIDFDKVSLSGIGFNGNSLENESYIWGVAISSDKANVSTRIKTVFNQLGWDNWEDFINHQTAKFVDLDKDESCQIGNLIPGTTYYYCLLVEMAGNIISSEVREFTTKNVETTDFVDLGLSVKWASRNIGQTSPWSMFHEQDGTELNYYDALTAVTNAYGSSARLPTVAEFNELLSCLSGAESECIGGCAVVTGNNGKQIAIVVGSIYWTSTPQYNTDEAHLTASIYTTYPWRGWNWSTSSTYGSDNTRSKYFVRAVRN